MQAFFQIVTGVRAGQTVAVDPSRDFVIGRKVGDLVLDDTMVSGKHCTVAYKDGLWHLTDHGSTNGTMVNGRVMKSAILAPGVELTIGQSRMVLMVGSQPEAEAEGRGSSDNDTAWLLDEELLEPMRERGRKPVDAIGLDLRLPPGLHALVEVVAGQDAGKVYRFGKGQVKVGRRTGEVPLSDVEVSKQHAMVELFGREMIFVRDMGSTNGTYVNGRRVRVSRLEAGDTIGVGKTVLKLQISSA